MSIFLNEKKGLYFSMNMIQLEWIISLLIAKNTNTSIEGYLLNYKERK